MKDVERRRVVQEFLSDLVPDPFADVLNRSEAHRDSHGCDLYPAGPHVMGLAAMIARASGARRILDLGAGIGYSAFWLASSAGDATVEAIDRSAEHVAIGRELAAGAGLEDRVSFLRGDVAGVLDGLDGSYDLVHDDAWFAAEPPYVERVLELLRPGGTWTMPNWFLLEDAVTGEPRRDWSAFLGPDWTEEIAAEGWSAPGGSDWAGAVTAYARRLARHPELSVTWVISPPLGIAVKRDG